MSDARPEEEIFSDLASICEEAGFAHVVAFFCLRDNIILHGGWINEGGCGRATTDRIIRTEVLR